jgi:hypothetical protein
MGNGTTEDWQNARSLLNAAFAVSLQQMDVSSV